MQARVLIRVDGNSKIGLGHFVRCIAIAHMLKNEYEICFVSLHGNEKIKTEIIRDGFFYLEIESENEFFEMLSGTEFVIIDHYDLGTDYQKDVKDKGCRLICVDDLHDKEFYADLIINHALGIIPSNYDAQSYTQYALGTAYALLRPAFLEAAGTTRDYATGAGTILICFGGSDPENLTARALNVIIKFSYFKKIIIIAGAACRHLEDLKKIAVENEKIDLYYAIEQYEIAKLMLDSEMAIVPASGILLEALAAGCHVISGMYADNQKNLFENYKAINAFVSAEDFSVDNLDIAINYMIQNRPVFSKIIDGKSSQRILRLFNQLTMENTVMLRVAKKTDLNKTYCWAKDKRVRAFSFSQNEINFEEHSGWFLSKIDDPNCYYYIAEVKDTPIGSIRFDIKDEKCLISYLVDPDFHKFGFGVILLKKGLLKVLSNPGMYQRNIIGIVMKNNVASCRAFEKLSFEKYTENENYKFLFINRTSNANSKLYH